MLDPNQIEACRKLKERLRKEAIDQFPFKENREAEISTTQIDNYKIILDKYKALITKEENLWAG